jgi:hypothetical protein
MRPFTTRQRRLKGRSVFIAARRPDEPTPSKGLVFSRDRADAAAYAAKIGGELSYVDVPTNRVAELKAAANKPEARVVVSAELARGRRVAEPVQMTQAAPQQSAPTARMIAPPAEYREPPRVAGSERFYHGGKGDEQPSAKGMVFSRDAADAGRYAFKTGGQLSYVDVAKERMSEVQSSSKTPATRVVVSPALARERQVVPIVQSEKRSLVSNDVAPVVADQKQDASGAKRPSGSKAPTAETEAARTDGAPTSDAGRKRSQPSKRGSVVERIDRTRLATNLTEEVRTPARSSQLAALRDKQRATDKQPQSKESGQEM